jgi:hypothetical protein
VIWGHKKSPGPFQAGRFGSVDAIVRLRAHASEGPRGRFGFQGAFGREHHGADLCGRPAPPSTGFGSKNKPNRVEQGIPITP